MPELDRNYWLIGSVANYLSPKASPQQIRQAMTNAEIPSDDFKLSYQNFAKTNEEIMKIAGYDNNRFESFQEIDQEQSLNGLNRKIKSYMKIYKSMRDRRLDVISKYDLRNGVHSFLESKSQNIKAGNQLKKFWIDENLLPDKLKNNFNLQLKEEPSLLTQEKLQEARNNFRENPNVLATPFVLDIDDYAKRMKKTREQVRNNRTVNLSYDLIQKEAILDGNNSYDNITANNQVLQQDEINDGVDIQEVMETLAAFTAANDLKNLRRNLPQDMKFNKDSVKQTKRVLRHLYDKGMTFSITASSDTKKNQFINANLDDANNSKVRILTKNPNTVGSIYNGEGTFYFDSREDDKSKANPYLPIDFVTGNADARIQKLKGGNSRIYPDDNSRRLIFKNNDQSKKVYEEVSVDEATDKVNEYLENARNQYSSLLLGDSLDGIDPIISEDQKALYEWKKDIINPNYDFVATDADIQNEFNDNDEYKEMLDGKVKEFANERVGTIQGFNPNLVVNLNSQISRNDILPELIHNLKTMDYDSDNFIGEDATLTLIKDRMLKFDKDSEKTIEQQDNPFLKRIMEIGFNELNNNGVQDLKLTMDDNGIISYSGNRMVGQSNMNPEIRSVEGQIGQVFAPDEHNLIHTKFGSKDDYTFVPGKEGYFAFGNPNQDRMERLRINDYESLVSDRVVQMLRRQVLRTNDGNVATPSDTSILNKLYHGDVYGKRFDKDWYQNSELSAEIKDAIINTESNRVKLPKRLNEYATSLSKVMNNENQAKTTIGNLVDHNNMRELPEDYTGYFDQTMTSTGTSQGLTLYLGNGVTINDDKSVNPVVDENGVPKEVKSGIRSLDYFKYDKYNAWDRNQMASNQILTALRVDNNVNASLMTFGGATMEDGSVVSKEFAERNQVEDVNGNPRPLKIGDKLSDFGGNKNTISMIIDRDMTPEQAQAANLEHQVSIFKENPELDVVMSPYSVITRDNAGVVKELSDSDHIQDIKDHGQTIGEMGQLNLIVTDMTVDHKTHVYEPEDIRNGKGSSASSQVSWALNAFDADNITKAVYGNNDKSWNNLREYMIATGLDLDANGNMQVGYHPHENENRILYEANDDKFQKSDDFLREISNHGGMLQLPFEVKMASGVSTKQLPILSSGLRRNVDLVNGNTEINDYTKDYSKIFTAVKNHLDNPSMTSEQTTKDQEYVQNIVDGLQNKIIDDKLGGNSGQFNKHSFIRDNIMKKRMPNSATAVATNDPRLDIDTIAVSKDIYKNLRLENENDKVVLFRNPVIHKGSMRGMNVKVDDNLTGFAMNPAITESFAGDFDGDTYPIWGKIGSSRDHDGVQKDLENMSVSNNLMEQNRSTLNISMDVVSGALNAGLVQKTEDHPEGLNPKKQVIKKLESIAKDNDSKQAKSLTNDFLKQSMESDYGAANVLISSPEKTKDSLQAITDSAAKGSDKHISKFMKYYDGQATLEDAVQVQGAAGMKADVTGIAGSKAQLIVPILRNKDINLALQVTEPVTQAVLQYKHDAEEAKYGVGIITNELTNVFNGKPAIPNGDDEQIQTAEGMKSDLDRIFNNQLNVDVPKDTIDAFVDKIADKQGNIPNLTEQFMNASPVDQIAYGNGYKTMKYLAENNRNLVEGEKAQLFAPNNVVDFDKDVMIDKTSQVENEEATPVYGSEIEELEL